MGQEKQDVGWSIGPASMPPDVLARRGGFVPDVMPYCDFLTALGSPSL